MERQDAVVECGGAAQSPSPVMPESPRSPDPATPPTPTSVPTRRQATACGMQSNTAKAIQDTLPSVFVQLVLLPAMLVALLGPFLGAAVHMPAVVERQHVLVVNLDGPSSSVMAVLQQFLAAAEAASTVAAPIPAFEVVSATDVSSIHAMADRVHSQDAWAGIVVNAGTDAALYGVLAAVPNATSWRATSALTFIWDEGRAPTFAPRIASPTRSLLQRFQAVYAGAFMHRVAALPNGDAVLSSLATSQPTLLATPVGYTELNLSPASVMPIQLQALTVGLALMLVLGLAVMKTVTKLTPTPTEEAVVADSGGRAIAAGGWRLAPPPSGALVAKRVALHLLGTAAVSGIYVILVRGFAGDTFTASPVSCLQIWALQWALCGSVSFYMAAVHEVVGLNNLDVAFIPVAYYNVLGGWNLDSANAGYAFFQYSPLFHVARVVRHVLFGAFPDAAVATDAGIVVLWWAVGLALYLAIACIAKPMAWKGRAIASEEGPRSSAGDVPSKPSEDGNGAVTPEAVLVDSTTNPAAQLSGLEVV